MDVQGFGNFLDLNTIEQTQLNGLRFKLIRVPPGLWRVLVPWHLTPHQLFDVGVH